MQRSFFNRFSDCNEGAMQRAMRRIPSSPEREGSSSTHRPSNLSLIAPQDHLRTALCCLLDTTVLHRKASATLQWKSCCSAATNPLQNKFCGSVYDILLELEYISCKLGHRLVAIARTLVKEEARWKSEYEESQWLPKRAVFASTWPIT